MDEQICDRAEHGMGRFPRQKMGQSRRDAAGEIWGSGEAAVMRISVLHFPSSPRPKVGPPWVRPASKATIAEPGRDETS